MTAGSDSKAAGVVPRAASLAELLTRFPQVGRVIWIGLRPGPRLPLSAIPQVDAIAGQGLAGDHYRPGMRGSRQVTLIQAEHLPVVGALLGRPAPGPELLRRNLVVAGINLLALKGMRFRVGEAVLEGSGFCHPCSRMEEVLGRGGYNAMRGHGGLTARVVIGGSIGLGDAVEALGPIPSEAED
jgi:MOSC domain-containing protein YiiM